MFDFLTTKKTIDGVKQNYRGLFQTRLDVQAEIVQIRNAPTNRADICKLAQDWVDRSAVNFSEIIAARFNTGFNLPGTSPVDFGLFALAKNHEGSGTLESLDATMCGLFGKEIKKCLTDAIMAAPWPNEGLSQAERVAKIAKLTTREKELTDELTALVKAADQSGIEI